MTDTQQYFSRQFTRIFLIALCRFTDRNKWDENFIALRTSIRLKKRVLNTAEKSHLKVIE